MAPPAVPSSETVALEESPRAEREASIPRWRLLLVEAVAIAGAAVSGLLLLQHHGDVYATAAVEQVCGETAPTSAGAAPADSGCEAVARSAYSEYNGIPIAAIGLQFYFSLALLLMFAVLFREMADAGAFLALLALALALVVDLMLLGVQAIAIKAFCKLCLLTYLFNVAGLGLLLPVWRGYRSPFRAFSSAGGRAALVAWAISSFTFALTVVALDWALGMSGRQRHEAAILGSPASAATPVAPPSSNPAAATPGSVEPSPTPAASAAPSELHTEEPAKLAAQLEAARAETRRLQETLDDPRKLEQYFTDKAMREFETAPAQELGLPNTPFKGPEDAPIKVVEFSDFMCPFCRQIAGAFANFLPRSSNRVSIYFKNYPLDQACNPGLASTVHAGACNLALGAVCAQEQGKFWPYHDKVFGSQLNNPQPKDVVTLAGSAGLDAGAFETCLGSQKAKDRLAAEIQEGVSGGVKATPTLFINGKRLPRVNDFLSVLDKEAARLGLPPLSPQPAN